MSSMEKAVIIDALRTPIGRYAGALKDVRPDDLAALVVREAVHRNQLDPASIEDVYFGDANQAGEDNRNVARMAVLLAGLPVEIPAATMNRLCGSGMQAVGAAAPGHFRKERVAGALADGSGLKKDEGPRRDTSLEKLASLKPAFEKEGTVTAGNSSPLNDGAACLVLMAESHAERIGARPLARILAAASAGVDPSFMGLGPIPASRKALARAGLRVSDLDGVELNEAFASQVLACMRDLELDPERVNPNGGAIALGHPLGASGARLIVTLVHELIRRKARYGLATMCIGVGQGISTVVENLQR